MAIVNCSDLLHQFIDRFGEQGVTNPGRLKGFLSDYIPDRRREVKALLLAAEEGAFRTFGAAEPDGIDLEIEKLSANLQRNQGLRADIALWASSTWAAALGKGRAPGPYVESAGNGRSGKAAADADDPGWVSMSAGAAASPVTAPQANPVAASPSAASLLPPRSAPAAASASRPSRWRALLWVGLGIVLSFVGIVVLGLYLERREQAGGATAESKPAQGSAGVPSPAPTQPVAPGKSEPAGSSTTVPVLQDAKLPERWPVMPLGPAKEGAYDIRFSARQANRDITYQLKLTLDPSGKQGAMTMSARGPRNGAAEFQGPVRVVHRQSTGNNWLVASGGWANNALDLPPVCMAIRLNGAGPGLGTGRTTMCLLDETCQAAVSCGTLELR